MSSRGQRHSAGTSHSWIRARWLFSCWISALMAHIMMIRLGVLWPSSWLKPSPLCPLRTRAVAAGTGGERLRAWACAPLADPPWLAWFGGWEARLDVLSSSLRGIIYAFGVRTSRYMFVVRQCGRGVGMAGVVGSRYGGVGVSLVGIVVRGRADCSR